MLLQFDNLDQLREVIEAMGYVKRQPSLTVESHITQAPIPGELTVAVLREMPDPVEAVSPELAAEQGNESAPTEQPESISTAGLGNESAPPEQPEQPKRKRRTKAEMEAARAVETQPVIASGTETSPAISGNASNAASDNPFEANVASPTTQAILNAPNQQAATLAGIVAMQTQSPFETAAVAATVETAQTESTTATQSVTGDADTFIEARSLELLTSGADLTPIKHMHVCREFIAKHGQAKYLQGFTLAGLPATVGTYKAEQCARHQAALEFLNAN